jgi:hypothetical protein
VQQPTPNRVKCFSASTYIITNVSDSSTMVTIASYPRYLDSRVPLLRDYFDHLVASNDYSLATKKRRVNEYLRELEGHEVFFSAPDVNIQTHKLFCDLIHRAREYHESHKLGRGLCPRTNSGVAKNKRDARRPQPVSEARATTTGQSRASTAPAIRTTTAVDSQLSELLLQLSETIRSYLYTDRRNFTPVAVSRIHCATPEKCCVCLIYHNEMLELDCKHRICSLCLNSLLRDSCPQCRARLGC